MNLRRTISAAALTAGLTVTAWGQTPPPPAGTPTAPTPAASPSTPPPPAPYPDQDKAAEALGKNDVAGALKFFEDAYAKDKKLMLPKVKLAEMLYSVQNQQAVLLARQYLENAGAENPKHPDPYIMCGSIALIEGRYMEGTLCFETALVKAGDSDWNTDQRLRFNRASRAGLARCYSSRGEYDRALTQLQRILEDEKSNAVVRKDYAQLLFLFNKPEEAFKELQQAHKDDPNNAQIGLPEVNMSRFAEGKPSQATEAAAKKADEAANLAKSEEWMKKAIEAHAKDVKAFREYGRWLLNRGRIDEADKQLATARTLDASDNEAAALTGLSFRYKKQYDQAEKIFDDLNRKERSNPAYAWNLALCKAESADKKIREEAIAIASLIQAAQSQSKSPEGPAVLAYCLFKNDRNDDALRAINSAVQVSQGRLPPDNIYYFSRIQDKAGKGEDARDKLKIAIDSKDAFVYRKDAEAFYAELVKKHGEKKPEEKKP